MSQEAEASSQSRGRRTGQDGERGSTVNRYDFDELAKRNCGATYAISVKDIPTASSPYGILKVRASIEGRIPSSIALHTEGEEIKPFILQDYMAIGENETLRFLMMFLLKYAAAEAESSNRYRPGMSLASGQKIGLRK